MSRSMISAIAILIALAIWMISGSQDDSMPEQSQETAQRMPPKVQVVASEARQIQRLTRVQGQVQPLRVVQLKAEVEGQVTALPVAEGDRVETQRLLVQLAEDARPARVAEAMARVKQYQADVAASEKLLAKKLAPESRMLADQAALGAAQAALAQAEFELEHTQIQAPFNGVLNQLMVEVGDFVEKGQVVAEFVDDSALVVQGQVPQHSIGGLQRGQRVAVAVASATPGTAPGPLLTGTIKFISATASEVTRSYSLEVKLDPVTDSSSDQALVGLSATLLLPVAEEWGHWLPSSALGLASDGGLQVKWVDEQQRVQISDVSLIRTEREGFWLAGLPQQVQLITVGHAFVSAGEQVEPVMTTLDVPSNPVDQRLAAVAASPVMTDSMTEPSEQPAAVEERS